MRIGLRMKNHVTGRKDLETNEIILKSVSTMLVIYVVANIDVRYRVCCCE